MVDRIRSQDPPADALARLPEPERLLSRSGQRFGPHADTLRRVALAALAVGLTASISVSQIALGVLALAVLTLGALRGGLRPAAAPRALPLFWPIVAFAAWSLASALASARPLESLVATKSVVWLGAVWVLVHALATPGEAQRFARLFLAAILVVSGVAVVQVLGCPETAPGGAWNLVFRKCTRARGFYSIYMTLGGVLMLVMVATVPWLVRGAVGVTWLGAGWLVAAAALALTQVRGAWAGLVVGVVVVAAATGRRVVLVGLAVLALIVLALSPSVRARFVYDQAADDRLAMIAGGLAIARDHPVAGIGPGQVKHVYPQYAPAFAHRRSTSHLHDAPLQILVERGVVGLACWAALFVAFFLRARAIHRALPPGATNERALVLGAAAAIASFLGAGIFEYNFGDTEVLLVACALMAVPFIVERMRTSLPE